MKMVGVGLIGLGYWGPNYLRVLRQIPSVEYLAVCDTNRAQLVSLHDAKIQLYDTHKAFFNDKNIQAIIIATPPLTHYDLTKMAINEQKHVLVEKPMTLSADQAQELSDLADNQQLILGSGHIFLYNDGIEYLNNHINKPSFGKIHEIECIRQSHGPIRTEVNVLWDLAPHDIAIALYLLNKMPHTVSAEGVKYLEDTQQEDSAIIQLYFDDHVYCNMKVNWRYPIKERLVTVIGSRSMIQFSDTDVQAPIKIYEKSVERHGEQSYADYGTFKMITKDGGYHVPSMKIREPLLIQINDFLRCINEHKNPKSDGKLGVKVVQILEAAQYSLRHDGIKVKI